VTAPTETAPQGGGTLTEAQAGDDAGERPASRAPDPDRGRFRTRCFTQVIGGLEIQVVETITALNRIGCNARLVNPYVEKLSDFDVIHVFASAAATTASCATPISSADQSSCRR
jgi:hypothetical protein